MTPTRLISCHLFCYYARRNKLRDYSIALSFALALEITSVFCFIFLLPPYPPAPTVIAITLTLYAALCITLTVFLIISVIKKFRRTRQFVQEQLPIFQPFITSPTDLQDHLAQLQACQTEYQDKVTSLQAELTQLRSDYDPLCLESDIALCQKLLDLQQYHEETPLTPLHHPAHPSGVYHTKTNPSLHMIILS